MCVMWAALLNALGKTVVWISFVWLCRSMSSVVKHSRGYAALAEHSLVAAGENLFAEVGESAMICTKSVVLFHAEEGGKLVLLRPLCFRPVS